MKNKYYLIIFVFVVFPGIDGAAQDLENMEFYGQVLQAMFEDAEDSNRLETKPMHRAKTSLNPVVNYDIYRDCSPYPVDPRKPCNVCSQRKGCTCKCCQLNRIPGFQGRPYQEREPGGCLCGKRHSKKHKHPRVSVYWPSPAAGVSEALFPAASARRTEKLDRFRFVNIFDGLGGFEVSCYERKDNGYCGPGRDRFGCLGESRQLQSQVGGVGFREPGQPVARGIVYP